MKVEGVLVTRAGDSPKFGPWVARGALDLVAITFARQVHPATPASSTSLLTSSVPVHDVGRAIGLFLFWTRMRSGGQSGMMRISLENVNHVAHPPPQ